MKKENILKLKTLIKEKLNGEILCFIQEMIIIKLDTINRSDTETEHCLTSSILKELLEIINPSHYCFNIVQNDTTNYIPYLYVSFYL